MDSLVLAAPSRRFSLGQCGVCAWAAAALLCIAFPVLADESLPGNDVASIRAWLLAHNPELRAMQAEADAAQARELPAGALPDPMIGVRLEGIDRDRPNLLPGNVDMATYSIRQTVPLWGKRALSREVARGQADAMRLERDAQALALLADAEQAYVRYWHADEGLRVIDRLIALLVQVEEVARERYALGVAAQQDAIRAQVAGTRMQGERIERVSMRHEAVAQLNASLGRAADAPLAQPLTEPILAVPAETLAEGLAAVRGGHHPAIRARETLAEAADRAEQLQRRQRLPDLSVGLGAMQQGSRLDGYELMLEVEIPLQRRALREREREARLMSDAARARVDAEQAALQARVGEAWARWASARDRRQLFAHTLLPQTEANFESALSSYRVGEVDFATLLEALEAWQGADLSRLDALRDELTRAAELRALIGSTP
jgi:outer membrane protein TolC